MIDMFRLCAFLLIIIFSPLSYVIAVVVVEVVCSTDDFINIRYTIYLLGQFTSTVSCS